MNADKKERRRLTDADRLKELHDVAERLAAKSNDAWERYYDALTAAHERAEKAKASLPPMKEVEQ